MGGASDGILRHRQTFPEVQSRGRWKYADRVRRYAKPGKIQQALYQLTVENLMCCERAHSDLERLFLQTQAPGLP